MDVEDEDEGIREEGAESPVELDDEVDASCFDSFLFFDDLATCRVDSCSEDDEDEDEDDEDDDAFFRLDLFFLRFCFDLSLEAEEVRVDG